MNETYRLLVDLHADGRVEYVGRDEMNEWAAKHGQQFAIFAWSWTDDREKGIPVGILEKLVLLDGDMLLKVSLAAQIIRSYRAARQTVQFAVKQDPAAFEADPAFLSHDLGGEG